MKYGFMNVIRAFFMSAIFASFLSSADFPGVFSDYETKIPDAKLRTAIEDAAGKTFGSGPSKISVSDLSKIRWIRAENRGIKDLTGLSFLSGLESIDFPFNDIADLSPLMSMRQLKNIVLDGDPVGQDQVSKLTSKAFPLLERIVLSARDKDDVERLSFGPTLAMLSAHTHLNYLGLFKFGAGLGDEEFAELYDTVLSRNPDSITALFLDDNDIGDASLPKIASLPKLEMLSLEHNVGTTITTIAPLAGLKNLNYLHIWATRVSDLGPLRTMYGAGAFHTKDSEIRVWGLNMDLRPGSTNRVVVDYLVNRGVRVQYTDGNILSAAPVPMAFLLGFIVPVCLISLFGFINTRDSGYLWFIAYLAVVGLTTGVYTGFLGTFLSIQDSTLNRLSVAALALLTLAGLAFAYGINRFRGIRGMAAWFRIIGVVCLLCLVLAIAGKLLPGVILSSLSISTAFLVTEIFVLIQAIKGDRFARFFAAAWSLTLACVLVGAACTLFEIPLDSDTAVYVLIVALLVQASIISAGLSDRTRASRRGAELQRDRIIRQERLAALGTLAAKVVHEIGNPNHVIGMQVSMLRWVSENAAKSLIEKAQDGVLTKPEDANLNTLRDEVPRLLEGIETASSQISQIMQSLRTELIPAAPSMEDLDLRDLVRDTLGLYEPGIRATTNRFSIRADSEPVVVRGSRLRLQQLLLNLVNNAVHALSSRDQAIEVRVEKRKKAENEQEAVLLVRDEGRGMPAHVLSRLGEAFFSTRNSDGGTGLGLSVCFDVAQEHEGRLEFASSLGSGTTAIFSLPFRRSL